MNGLKELIELLGEKNVERLRERIVDIIIDRIKEDLEDWDEYLLNPDDYKSFFSDCFEEAKNSTQNQITNQMKKRILNACKDIWESDGE